MEVNTKSLKNSLKRYRTKRSRSRSISSNNENANKRNSKRNSKKIKTNPKPKSKRTIRSSSAPPKLPSPDNDLNHEISGLTQGMDKL